MKYTKPKLYKGKDEWYVYFKAIDPQTGQMRMKKEREGLNKKDVSKLEKIAVAESIIETFAARLKAGWSPWGVDEGNKDDFYWWFSLAIKRSEVESSSYHTDRLRSVLNKMKEFRASLRIESFDENIIYEYRAFCKSRGNSDNTIHDNIVRISRIVKMIVKDGRMPYHKNPFLDYKGKTTKPKRGRLTLDQIRLLESAELTGKDAICRDMYIFSFYNAGIRFGDLCRFQNSWISERVSYNMNKTGARVSFAILPNIVRIIKEGKDNGKYLFKTGFNPDKPEKSIKNLNNVFNAHLKSICKKLKLPAQTFHTARHSFASHAKSQTKDIYSVQKLLAHDSPLTSQQYLGSFADDDYDRSMKEIFPKTK